MLLSSASSSLATPLFLLLSIAVSLTTKCSGFSAHPLKQQRPLTSWRIARIPKQKSFHRDGVIVSSSQRPSPQQQQSSSSFNKENLATATTTTTTNSESFWNRQKELAEEMSQAVNRSIKAEQLEKFAKRRMALVSDTGYYMVLIFAALWMWSDNPFVAISYLIGATCGLAYSYGLGKYVETLGGSVDDDQEVQGAGLGAARYAFLILLFVLVGKFRSFGFLEIPAIMGFFTYQLATLSQGLREIND